jgi:hypothetical protein
LLSQAAADVALPGDLLVSAPPAGPRLRVSGSAAGFEDQAGEQALQLVAGQQQGAFGEGSPWPTKIRVVGAVEKGLA